jgi:retron-type reverse transcriptase
LQVNIFSFLTEARQAIEENLAKVRLKIHPIKSQLFATQHGANFLGFRIFPDRIRVRTENLRRSRRRLRKLASDYAANTVTLEQVTQSLQSWEAHLKHGDTYKLRQQIFTSLAFVRR